MKVTVIGGGNIGTLMAAEFAFRGHEVTVYTSKPERWKREIKVYNAKEELLLIGRLSKVTDSMREALENAEYVWVTMPAQMFEGLGKKMLPFVCKEQKIGVVPGSGGAEAAFYDFLQKGCVLFGLQRVHSIARLKRYGESVYELGRKAVLQLGAIPADRAVGIAESVEKLLDMPCEPLDNYLCVTLAPSNSILHTTRLYRMFREYKKGDIYPENFLFYEGWTRDSSELLIACDRELQEICRIVPLELEGVMSLCDYYESYTADAMTKKIRSIKAFKGVTSPMKREAGGFVPDWDSRYFATDFPFGLKTIRDIAKLFDVPVPNIDTVWNWYDKTVPKVRGRVPTACLDKIFPQMEKKEFVKLYEKGNR